MDRVFANHVVTSGYGTGAYGVAPAFAEVLVNAGYAVDRGLLRDRLRTYSNSLVTKPMRLRDGDSQQLVHGMHTTSVVAWWIGVESHVAGVKRQRGITWQAGRWRDQPGLRATDASASSPQKPMPVASTGGVVPTPLRRT
jgi:hypothetical protein